MAYLINRAVAARLECLHALVQLIHSKFGNNNFALKDVKFDRNAENIHKYCRLLQENSITGVYCRFKDNPLDESGCAITNAVDCDTTKSKEVSNTVNALHALGLVERRVKYCRLTEEGIIFSQTEYGSEAMTGLIRQGVLKYGPAIGILAFLESRYNAGDTFSAKDITVGYPSTQEYVEYKGKTVEISSGSKQDSNIRTKSCLLAWLTTAGFIRPVNIETDDESPVHLKYRSYINSAHRNKQIYEIVEIPGLIEVDRPLDYNNLTKLNSGLRERGMADVREVTMRYESIIKNRRFAIIYLLNKAYEKGMSLSVDLLIDLFNKYPGIFIVSKDNLKEVVDAEIEIAFMAGIPYEVEGDADGANVRLRPMLGINMIEASIGAPNYLVGILSGVELYG